jgi:hypothetical protein
MQAATEFSSTLSYFVVRSNVEVQVLDPQSLQSVYTTKADSV